MGKLPFDLTKVSMSDLFPEGRFRARVVSVEQYPKNQDGTPKELNEDMTTGEMNEKGEPKYGWLRVGFRFVEHPSNYTVDPKTGKEMPLTGRQIYDNFSFHPLMQKKIRELYNNTGTPADQPTEALKDKEADIIIKNKPRKDDEEIVESRVSAVRVAVDR